MPRMFSFLSTVQFTRDESTQWFVLAVGVMATGYLVLRGRAKRRKDPFERPAAMGDSQQRQLERDISNLMVEMLETARQMTAQLDTRATRLELLLKEADAKLAALKTATATPAKPTPATSPTTTVPPEPEVLAPVAKPEPLPDPRHADVYAKADQGLSLSEIARELGRPSGEVELILALRPH